MSLRPTRLNGAFAAMALFQACVGSLLMLFNGLSDLTKAFGLGVLAAAVCTIVVTAIIGIIIGDT